MASTQVSVMELKLRSETVNPYYVFQGHDTSTAAVNWAIYSIGTCPEVQAKLHEEMDIIFSDSDRPVTMEDLNEMKYLECVIKETLRLFPSAPLIGRVLEEDTLIGRKEIFWEMC